VIVPRDDQESDLSSTLGRPVQRPVEASSPGEQGFVVASRLSAHSIHPTSRAGAADEWDIVADAERLMAELRRHGLCPGQRLHVIALQVVDPTGETWLAGLGGAVSGQDR